MAEPHPDYEFYAGDEWLIDGVLHNPDGSVMDLTGATVEWAMEDAEGNVILSTRNSTASVAIIDAPTGRVRATVDKTKSAVASGTYYDQCRSVDAAGNPGTQTAGVIVVKKSFFV